ncbi:glycine cleavage system protein GcvH [Halochromatium glycolicum]|jgi:glycine cleavage system H protein|uniref:Glycine cleavage system H protein n=1 Tax=Halochromatium glycolicum TaxID=85075 RepID=A0AAJ0U681_9GAMM|nr:glycine cleavage system protein GcvH [Halochromatium glycolicum]MBK1705898.1 glycine cleavage system protein H [Halochromatium glycolicum]NBC47977.1 glycine cleavage system protein GcvH [Gammaproteobacteria bacterium]
MTIPTELKYTESHEWVKDNGDGTVTVGITDHAQDALGDLVFVELPEVGKQLAAKDACAVVESVKAASDIYSPVGGEVTAANEALDGAPETINEDAYGEGWIYQLKLSDPSELDNLLDAGAYEQVLADEG